MATEPEKLEGTLSAIRCFVPTFSLKLKSGSWHQRIIGRVMAFFGNKYYMSCYWTTINKTVYRPTACNQGLIEGEWEILLHEGRHADDCYKLGFPLFSFLYLFPQSIGILGVLYALTLIPALLLGAPTALLWGLLSLLCLLPIPSLPRATIEARGYLVSLCVDFWTGTLGDEEAYLDRLAQKFTNKEHYFMWFGKSYIKKYFRNKLESLKLGTLELDSYLMLCRSKAKAYKPL